MGEDVLATVEDHNRIKQKEMANWKSRIIQWMLYILSCFMFFSITHLFSFFPRYRNLNDNVLSVLALRRQIKRDEFSEKFRFPLNFNSVVELIAMLTLKSLWSMPSNRRNQVAPYDAM